MSQSGIINVPSSSLPPTVSTSFVTNSGTAIPVANTIDILGTSILADSIPVQTIGAGNTVTVEVQTSQAIAISDATKIGLAAFDSSIFSVDVNGFTTLNTPLSVSKGGTGNTFLTANAILLGNFNSPISSVSLGTNQLLIGVSGSNPTQVTAPTIAGQSLIYDTSSVIWFPPYQDILINDEFFSLGNDSDTGWVSVTGGGGTVDKNSVLATNAHPGVWEFVQGAGFANSGAGNGATLKVGGGSILADYVCKITPLSSAATNRYKATIGFASTIDGANTNLIGFTYTDNANGGKWLCNCIAATVASTSDSGIAADTNWHRFTISINAAGTSVSFFIDGIAVGSAITTNIPSVALSAVVVNANVSFVAGNASVAVDFWRYWQKLSNSR